MELLIQLTVLVLVTWFLVWLIGQLSFIPPKARQVITIVIAVIALILLVILIFPGLSPFHLGVIR